MARPLQRTATPSSARTPAPKPHHSTGLTPSRHSPGGPPTGNCRYRWLGCHVDGGPTPLRCSSRTAPYDQSRFSVTRRGRGCYVPGQSELPYSRACRRCRRVRSGDFTALLGGTGARSAGRVGSRPDQSPHTSGYRLGVCDRCSGRVLGRRTLVGKASSTAFFLDGRANAFDRLRREVNSSSGNRQNFAISDSAK